MNTKEEILQVIKDFRDGRLAPEWFGLSRIGNVVIQDPEALTRSLDPEACDSALNHPVTSQSFYNAWFSTAFKPSWNNRLLRNCRRWKNKTHL